MENPVIYYWDTYHFKFYEIKIEQYLLIHDLTDDADSLQAASDVASTEAYLPLLRG